MIPTHRLTASATALVAALAAPLAAQGPAMNAEPAQVLILGTFHFANPGLDVVQTEVADVLSDTKQAEIVAIAEALARFRPTRIAVEQLPATAPVLDSLYAAYRAGTHRLTRSETQQIGFRLAAMLGHVRVHPIDHQGEFPFGPLMQYAQAHDPAAVEYVQRELAAITAEGNRRQRELTIGEILRLSNDPTEIAGGHGAYMRLARIGAGDSYVGADLLAKWYERNIRIFNHIQLVADPGERVLVVIGSGHLATLRELVAADPTLTLVEAIDYLPASGRR
jgi:hypothetical protein